VVRVQAVPVIYALVRSCNRSEPHRELLKHAVALLHELARHPDTAAALWTASPTLASSFGLCECTLEKAAERVSAMEAHGATANIAAADRSEATVLEPPVGVAAPGRAGAACVEALTELLVAFRDRPPQLLQVVRTMQMICADCPARTEVGVQPCSKRPLYCGTCAFVCRFLSPKPALSARYGSSRKLSFMAKCCSSGVASSLLSRCACFSIGPPSWSRPLPLPRPRADVHRCPRRVALSHYLLLPPSRQVLDDHQSLPTQGKRPPTAGFRLALWWRRDTHNHRCA